VPHIGDDRERPSVGERDSDFTGWLSLRNMIADFQGEGEKMKLTDAIAIITGGGSGLGEATAREFAAAGARVVILDLPNSPGPKVAESFGEGGLFAPADVVSGEAVEAAIAAATKRFGTINVASTAPASAAPSARFRRTVRIRSTSSARWCR
jgi:NAD(P)-dependent dehydrogenase (short-subunit alcohol dehydrogenase family)